MVPSRVASAMSADSQTAATLLPRAILGTLTFGGQTSEDDAANWVHDFMENQKWAQAVGDIPMVDTAIMYQGGKTQEILGRILKPYDQNYSIATKANPFTKDKNLSPAGVRSQLEESLKALQRDSVDIFYLHAPDVRHPIEPTLEEVQLMFQEGKFRQFALSNFTAWETVYIHSYMSQRKGYVVPTIYQGMYNAITRQVESELFPALRKLGMSFYAYNPLAGGMLSGKYTLVSEGQDEAAAAAAVAGEASRFAGNSFWAKRYRERFQQKQQFEALEIIRETLFNNEASSMADASLRWMRHHSQLSGNDGIIVGASKTSQFQANMNSLSAGPLSNDTVAAFDKASRLCEDVCPNYSRGYSGSACLS